MVLPRKQFISDNRVVHPPTAMDKKLNTDLTEDTDLTFSLIFLVGKWLLDFYQDFRGFASACGTPFSLANEHQPPLVLPRRGEAGYLECREHSDNQATRVSVPPLRGRLGGG